MIEAEGKRRQDRVFTVCQTPFSMLLSSGILQTDVDFGSKAEGHRKPGRSWGRISSPKGTLEDVLRCLHRLDGGADVALLFRFQAIFALAGGDGSMYVQLGYVSVRGTLVFLRRELCEFPSNRCLWLKEWDLTSPTINLQEILSEVHKLQCARSDETWSLCFGDNSGVYHVDDPHLMLNCPEFPQYQIGSDLAKSKKHRSH